MSKKHKCPACGSQDLTGYAEAVSEFVPIVKEFRLAYVGTPDEIVCDACGYSITSAEDRNAFWEDQSDD